MNLRKTTILLINKYAEYRGNLDSRLTVDLLVETFIAADQPTRIKYTKEMKQYIKLVDEGKLEKGVPLEVLELSS
jgi:hypothetical protein